MRCTVLEASKTDLPKPHSASATAFRYLQVKPHVKCIAVVNSEDDQDINDSEKGLPIQVVCVTGTQCKVKQKPSWLQLSPTPQAGVVSAGEHPNYAPNSSGPWNLIQRQGC